MKKQIDRKIPEPTVIRLCQMYRFLENLCEKNIQKVFSNEIGRQLGIHSHTVRKDISYLGEIGNTSAGYDVNRLKSHIYNNLGLDKTRNACIVGLGKLGQAIINYEQFIRGNYRIIAGFDSDINTIEILKARIMLYPSYQIKEILAKMDITLGIIAVPAASAQNVADRLISGGIMGIINFAPVTVKASDGKVLVRNVDLDGELRILSALLMMNEINLPIAR